MIDWTKPIRTTYGARPLSVAVQVRLPDGDALYYIDGSPCVGSNGPRLENYTLKPPTVKFVPDGEPRKNAMDSFWMNDLGEFQRSRGFGFWTVPTQFYKRIEEPSE